MAVETFNGTPSDHVNEALRKIFNDLTGHVHDSSAGATSTEYFKLVWNNNTGSNTIDSKFDTAGPFAETENLIIILESTINIDPYARATLTDDSSAYDPWRIAFHTSTFNRWPYEDANQQLINDPNTTKSMAIYVGSPTTLWSDGTDSRIAWKQKLGNNLLPAWTTQNFDSSYLDANIADLIEPLGHVGKTWTHNFDPITTPSIKWGSSQPQPLPDAQAGWLGSTQPANIIGDGPDVDDPGQLFVNRHDNSINTTLSALGGLAASTKNSNPVIYKIVTTDHGLFLGTWGKNPEEYGEGFSWMVVQRGVSKDTGITRGLPVPGSGSVGNRPLFCVGSVGNNYFKFVVREHDLDVPSEKKNAARNTEDSAAVLNPYQQQSLTENGEYVVTFINNLNSSRFKYSDELDMVGTVSADVIGGGTSIEVNVYGEDSNRTYEAMWPGGVPPEVSRDRHVATNLQKVFSMNFNGTYLDGSDVEVYSNGELVNPLRYTVTYGTPGNITLKDGVAEGTVIEIIGTGKKVGAFGTGMRIVVVQDIPTPNTP
jgi:hypothetical protein